MKPTVAVAQMDCRLGNVEKNIRTIEGLGRKASVRAADMVCFPELATTGYSLNRRWRDYAEPIPGSTTKRLSRIAGEFGFYLICGMVERDSRSSRIFDSSVLMDPQGEVAGVYRKVHRWSAERVYFTPGSDFPVFRTKFGTIGLGICYDLEFPEPARIMALKGAQIIFFSSAQPQPMEVNVDTYVRSRAGENCVFVCHSNRVGREGKLTFFGHSQIVSPLCRPLAKMGGSEGLAVSCLDLPSLKKLRRTKLPYMKHRITTAYSQLLSSR